jgi:hypothetical protein|tara:strand:+ start:435 stop:641 length:207 start_codon:yes stop_codon:yes gene_type:complete
MLTMAVMAAAVSAQPQLQKGQVRFPVGAIGLLAVSFQFLLEEMKDGRRVTEPYFYSPTARAEGKLRPE